MLYRQLAQAAISDVRKPRCGYLCTINERRRFVPYALNWVKRKAVAITYLPAKGRQLASWAGYICEWLFVHTGPILYLNSSIKILLNFDICSLNVKILLNFDICSLNEIPLHHEKLRIKTVNCVSNQNIMTKVHQIHHAGQTVHINQSLVSVELFQMLMYFVQKENMLLKHATFSCSDVNLTVWEIRTS
jgi:hypothetical protein